MAVPSIRVDLAELGRAGGSDEAEGEKRGNSEFRSSQCRCESDLNEDGRAGGHHGISQSVA